MLAEALRLLPPLVPQEADQLFDLDDPLNNQGFHSFLIFFSQKSNPRDLMREGRRQDVTAVFDALPVGSFWYVMWYVMGSKESWIWEKEDWEQLEHYMETEEPISALTSILNDQRKALSNAICHRFCTSNIPDRKYRNVFGKELRMRDIFLI